MDNKVNQVTEDIKFNKLHFDLHYGDLNTCGHYVGVTDRTTGSFEYEEVDYIQMLELDL